MFLEIERIRIKEKTLGEIRDTSSGNNVKNSVDLHKVKRICT